MKTTLRCMFSLVLVTGACFSNTDQDQVQEPGPSDLGEVAQAVTTTAFTATYTGQGANASTCNSSFTITGQEPSVTGTNPVFLYMVGTNESSTNASATAAVQQMAAKGFVAATIAYDSGSFNNCGPIQGKAKCIFDPNQPTSAVQTLCARAKADCSKGIVVAGFSQGSVIATQAKNTDARVRAAWGIGDGVQYSTFNLSSCQANGNRALSSNNLLVTNGQQDQFVGGGLGFTAGSITNVRSQTQTLTGLSCGSTATTCLQSNGSGWIIVLNNQVVDGSADHCFMRASGNLCSGSQNSLDANWQNGTDNWELGAALNFLNSFVSH